MIVELGHFALILALAAALVQMVLPAWGARQRDPRLMAVAEPAALVQLSLVAVRVPRAHARLRHVRLLGRDGVGQLALAQAADLQDLRRVGEPRGLDAAVGADPRRSSAPRSRCSAPICRPRCAPTCWPCRPASPSPSCSSSSSPPIPSCASRRSRRAAASIRSCRTPRSPSTRPSSTPATSASRSPSPSPSPR